MKTAPAVFSLQKQKGLQVVVQEKVKLTLNMF